ncbi:hypothetical protein BN1110_03724 [bacterium YEK0313]|nr:hypothetical protein BN1110_03724 [bacterium YEK0313]
MAINLSTGFRLTPENFLPVPIDVCAAFEAETDTVGAHEWMLENDIDPGPVIAVLGDVKLIDVVSRDCPSWTALALPLRADGVFVDTLLIDTDTFEHLRICDAVDWLGEDNISGTVRLHAAPVDWLRAGCAGCCSLHPYGRGHLRALRRADRIQCDDIRLALEAWEWGFGAYDNDLARFDIDDLPENVACYFQRQARAVA